MVASHEIGHDRPNGHSKSPEQIQLEIARTRLAITDDLLALTEKFSPAHLRAGAREVLHDAGSEVREVMREAKDAAIGSLRGAKDRALEAFNERLGELGAQARQAGALTLHFAGRHALALSLLGVGASWLLLTLRNRRRLSAGEPAYLHEHYLYPIGDDEGDTRAPRGVGTQASRAVDQARQRVRSSARELGEHAAELRARTAQRLRRAAGRTRELASDRRMAAVALTVAAGVGLGLLLPVAYPMAQHAVRRRR